MLPEEHGQAAAALPGRHSNLQTEEALKQYVPRLPVRIVTGGESFGSAETCDPKVARHLTSLRILTEVPVPDYRSYER